MLPSMEQEKSSGKPWKAVTLILALGGILVTLGVAASGNGVSANGGVHLKQAVQRDHELTEGDGETAKSATHFTYSASDKHGPSHWGELSAACTGRRQSPINIRTRSVIRRRGRSVAQFFYDQGGLAQMQHNPHTVDVLLPKQNDYVILRGKKYTFAQFHFHHPSEHTIDGRHADAEVHFVHLHQQGQKKEYVVFALMCYVPHNFEHDRENVLLKRVITESDVFPMVNGQDSQTSLGGMNILRRVGIGSGESVFEYEGSLTTPPCTETVTWLVRRKPAYMSRKALHTLKKSFAVNNRPVQALNKRVVTSGKCKNGRLHHDGQAGHHHHDGHGHTHHGGHHHH